MVEMKWHDKYDEGGEEGKEIWRREFVSRMLKRGKTAEEIVDFCDYPIEFVRKVENILLEET